MSIEGAPPHLSRRVAVVVAIAVALASTLAAVRLPLFDALELRLLDWRLRATAHPPPTDQLLIVAIEESALTSLDTWGPASLARYEYAPVVSRLAAHGARVIAVDIYFGDAEGNVDARGAADEGLAAAIAEAGNVVLVAGAAPEVTDQGEEVLNFIDPSQRVKQEAGGIASPLLFRPDNVVRWVQLEQTAADGKTALRALSFAAVQAATDGELKVPEANWPLMTINWAGPSGTVPRLKFEDVYHDRAEPSLIRDRIVFIGATDEDKDLLQTPRGPISGVEIHAQAAATMLAGRYIAPTGGALSLLLAAMALCVLLATLAVGRRAWQALLLTGLLVAIWIVFGYLAFRVRSLNIPMTGTAASLIVCGLLLSVLQSERVVTTLSRLWPSWVAGEGEEIEATVLVCDMAGYTARSEDTAPGEMMELMRGFFAIVDEAVEAYGGMLARRPGDAAIVFFRPEEEREHHTRRGLEAAVALRDRLAEAWRDSGLDFGITLTTGTVSLGFVGTSPPEPQILGDAVNVAFRLQGESRRLGESIIADWPTASADPATAKLMRPLGEVEVKGRRAPMQIFAPVTDASGPRPQARSEA